VAKRLILHIGANKTGSSTIQEFLRLNAEPLSRCGAVVAPSDLMPGGPVTGQHLPFLEHLRENAPDGPRIVADRVELLMSSLPEDGCLMISAENLSNLNGTHQLFADAAAKHDTQVILYIRRQDELLLSSWQQWGSKTSDDFWAWTLSAAGRRGNWRLVLEPWEELVGRKQITLRIYDRRHLHQGDLISDFLLAAGLANAPEEFERPPIEANPSYAAAVVDLVKANPLLFKSMHDNGPYEIVEALTGERFHRDPRESVITHEQRLALLSKYTAANAWVKNRYFPELEGPLFTTPDPADYVFVDDRKREEQKWNVVTTLLYELSRKVLTPE
jgi:hypothetical protein